MVAVIALIVACIAAISLAALALLGHHHQSSSILHKRISAALRRSFPAYAPRLLDEVDARPPVVKGGGKSIYVLTDGTLHHIPDWDTFVNLGYSQGDIRYIPDTELATYTMGNPVEAVFEPNHKFSPYPQCPCLSRSRYNVTENILDKKWHKICLVENEFSRKMFTLAPELNHHYSIDFKLIAGTNITATTDCDVVFKLIDRPINTWPLHESSYVCPGTCLPKPYIELPFAIFSSDFSALHNISLTCSLHFSDIFSEQSALYKHYTSRKGEESFERAALGIVMREIARRRLEECNEAEAWTSGLSPVDNGKELEKYHRTPRRKVYGLIIWVGSLSRIGLLQNQVKVLGEQSKVAGVDDSKRIFGWQAAEDIYSCRVGTTICSDVTRNWAYFNYMPTTQMNVVSSGWSCAQRRQLRSIQHSLLLFDPDFLLMVDDDTFVNIEVIKYGGRLTKFILNDLKTAPNVYGQLTLGKKITKRGFFYGGAGYLVGRASIDRLISNELVGPKVATDQYRDSSQMTFLALLRQIAPPTCVGGTLCANEKCPKENACVTVISNPAGEYTEFDSVAKLGTRLVEVCTNVMSEEHTCYHSDHALSRCFVHAAYLNPLHVDCGGFIGGQPSGMCMGGPCGLENQLTCHRYMMDPNSTGPNYLAVAADYKQTAASASKIEIHD